MIKLEYLVSTMNKDEDQIKELIKKMNIKTSCIIINQNTTIDNTKRVKDMTIINTTTKGLSKSRNLGIKNSKNDICVLADDDFIYYDDAEKIIKDAYAQIGDADIIAFKFKYKDNKKKFNKKFWNNKKKINKMNSLKISSAQITFRRKSIENAKVKFDEKFGSGSGQYVSGEENIFLTDCLNKKLKIYYVPISILEINDNRKSTWFNGFNEEYFITKGATYTRIYKYINIIMILQFAIRKYKLYKKNMSFLLALKYMIIGSKQIKRDRSK